MRAKGPTSKMVYSHGCWQGALPYGILHRLLDVFLNCACCHVNMAVNLPQSKQSKRKKGSYDAFYDLVTYCHFSHILFAVTKYSLRQKLDSTFLKEDYIEEYVSVF